MPLKKTVVITGAAGLIGKSFCKSVASYGYNLVIADKNEESAENLAAELRSDGHEAYACIFDATRAEDSQKLLDSSLSRFGNVYGLVNNLYIRSGNYGADFFDVTYNDFSKNLSDNVTPYFELSKKFSRHFYKEKSGNIINIASIYGCIAPKFEIYSGTSMTMPVEYAAIKSAIIHLTRYMARRFKGHNIRVNAISPGGVLDGQPEEFLNAYEKNSSSKGMLSPDDLCGTLLFLLSEESRYINGQNIIVDDGFTL
ncbi:oxidoreductase [Thalassolituus alkanivorans]|uniref:oxidoreductase n=1 Tax=Thalassolituus alkanivorans TaxID=2881055 RepID=UPI001E53230A|nr:oxidoreductase [Thalassolituus alkanivorans]MCB2385259.1 SDR family oxidoreductase [Thalassolituus alkanivorans]MCB2421884.1 SDR family oxidoreductase [Thalassolituus alkanivorans]